MVYTLFTMIAFLTGVLTERRENSITLDVQGVGYELFVSKRVLEELPMVGSQVTVHTHMHVREDAMVLFGFLIPAEREVFTTLLKISGVGPKAALAVLSQGSPAELANAVLTEQVSYFTSASGIGKKTAERLLMELTGVIEGFASIGASEAASAKAGVGTQHSDAVQALTQLGYTSREAEHAVHSVPADTEQTTEALVRAALRELARVVT